MDDLSAESIREKVTSISEEMSKGIVGQQNLGRKLLMALFCGGHVLLEGLPGLAKTTAIKTLGSICELKFSRVQFTPDLLPADVTGIEIYNMQKSDFTVKKGPIFANLVLADEINRAPSKVQAALLEAMEERQVTIGDTTYPLPEPFLVMATQNPVEQEGTYPLPEAQLDRFLFKVVISYGTIDDEVEIMKRVAEGVFDTLHKRADKDFVNGVKEFAKTVTVSDEVRRYMASLVFATRAPAEFGLSQFSGLIEYGASPRASLALEKASRISALFEGRDFVTPSDVKSVATDILRHRIKPTYEAEATHVTADAIVEKVLDTVAVV